jgi:hypothetical protein
LVITNLLVFAIKLPHLKKKGQDAEEEGDRGREERAER